MSVAAQALVNLTALANPVKAGEMAAYHKASRKCLGVSNPQIDALCQGWKKHPAAQRLAIAHHLWASDIHEAMVGAAKVLSQAKFGGFDTAVWNEIAAWVPDFDAWAIADHACRAGSYRLLVDVSRLDQVEDWTRSDNLWTRRAALVITLPWARLKAPDRNQRATRARILGWAARYVDDPAWFIQKSVSWWLRELSKRDPARTTAFLQTYGDRMKPFARKNAAKYLP